MAIWGRRPAKPSYLRLHLREPDYARGLLHLPPESRRRIEELLVILYGRDIGRSCMPELERLMQVYFAHKTREMIEDDRTFDPAERFTEEDAILITYGDMVSSPGKRPLQALVDLVRVLRSLVNTIHILPFFPYSSDRGFAIESYYVVDPRLGTWEDIERLGLDFKLMFDGVLNHVSSKNHWFQEFVNGNPRYRDYFITFSTREAIGEDHLQLILRPRTTPLLTEFQTLDGPRWVWTTFSPDQIDLNFKNPEVLLRIIDVMLYYVRRGADLIRLDAVAYVWYQLGTSCVHLRQAHALVQLLRAVLDVVAPRVGLITETNFPHRDNLTYFGDGTDEAQMVYNFALPPLVLHAFLTGDCSRLNQWAASLEPISDRATYFNFLDSHDGIGLLPVQDLLTGDEVDFLRRKAEAHGGLISHRRNSRGEPVPYELNITWYDALNDPGGTDDIDTKVDRFIASRSIALALMGVPGIYLPGLVGGRNDQEALCQTGEARSINRGVIHEPELFDLLGDPSTSFNKTAKKLGTLMEKRLSSPCFHPNADQRVLRTSDAVFSVLRRSRDGRQTVLALASVSAHAQEVVVGLGDLGGEFRRARCMISDDAYEAGDGKLRLRLRPYQVAWLELQ